MFRKKFIVFGLLMVAALFVFSTVSFADELSEIQDAIKAKKAKWVAGQTSMMRLTPEERRMRLGLGHLKSIPEDEGIPYEETFTAVPATFDWRNIDGNGTSFVTPIRNQRSCGSCWAFATAAGLESYTLMTQNIPNYNLDLGEQILISCYNTNGCSGGSPSGASYYLKTTGLPLESCFPYEAYDANDGGNSVFCSEACANWQQNTYKIMNYGSVSKNVSAIKDALVSYGPLVTTFSVYSDFFSYNGGIYSYTTGTYQGGHAVLIVGYDDVNQCFIVKNSWGTGWGESGYFRIDYSELNTVVNFGGGTLTYYGSLEVTCSTNAECDDSNVCTEDACMNSGTAEAYCSNISHSGSCDDGLFCTVNDICADGSCSGVARVCSDGVACTEDSCDEVSDICVYAPQDSLCDNGLYCDGVEHCDAALGCQQGTSITCSDGVDCTADSCNETTNQCDYTPNDANCSDDGLFCNGTETCNATGGCLSTGDPCSAGTTCNEETDTCEQVVGCGDGICAGLPDEDCSTCPSDCSGKSVGNPSKRWCCGNLICESSETATSCPADCGTPPVCGDGSCDPNEDKCNCPIDCGTPSSVEVGLCSDGIDNDCDSLTDCSDTDCTSTPACDGQCSQFKQPCNADPDCCAGLTCHPNKGYCR
jgi:C1A family cysteine protease